MNLEELLNYQPTASLEDRDDDDHRDSRRRSNKRKLVELESGAGPSSSSAAAAAAAAASRSIMLGDSLDESALKRLILQFERKLYKNQELRIKFGEEPTKFLDSEMELFDVLQEMHVLSTQPELYQSIVDAKVVSNLLGLLAHENTDISIAVTSLLHELSDVDNTAEVEQVSILWQALIDGQIIVQLVSNMQRLDETAKEESDCVYNSLAIIENLLDFKPELSKECQPLIVWILSRLKSKLAFDSNKLYAAEILSILLQDNEENRHFLGSQNGIDNLLRQISFYKRHEPSSLDEHEYMENLFDCLCSALHCDADNRALFFNGEGIELMNLILREKRKKICQSSVKFGAIKVIGHALSKDKAKDEFLVKCCDRFVETYGLRALFPILMTPKSIIDIQKKKKKEVADLVDEIEEHCLSIIVAILRHCCRMENRARCAYKFVEQEFEKSEKLIELHFKYAERVIRCDQQISKEKTRLVAEDEEVDEEDFFLRRLSAGLFTLQLVDHIIVMLSSDAITECISTAFKVNNEPIKPRLLKLIQMRSSSMNHHTFIRNIIKELAESEANQDDKNELISLLEQF